MRFWISFYCGDGDDMRPNYSPVTFPSGPCEWWCTGEREAEPRHTVCAVVDADDERAAWEFVRRFWPEAEERFCEGKPDDWRPDGGRFPRKAIR